MTRIQQQRGQVFTPDGVRLNNGYLIHEQGPMPKRAVTVVSFSTYLVLAVCTYVFLLALSMSMFALACLLHNCMSCLLSGSPLYMLPQRLRVLVRMTACALTAAGWC